MDSCKQSIFYHLEATDDVSLDAAKGKYAKDTSMIQRSRFGGSRRQGHDRDTWKTLTERTESPILFPKVVAPFLLINEDGNVEVCENQLTEMQCA